MRARRPPRGRPGRARRRGATLAGILLLPVFAHAGESSGTSGLPIVGQPAVQTWILHFDGSTSDFSSQAIRSLLTQIPTSTAVTVAVAGRNDEILFRQTMDLPPERWDGISFLTLGQPVSPWARDRYLILDRHGRTTIVLPDPQAVNANRRADLDVARSLALGERPVRLLTTRLAFEGGDLLIGGRVALVGSKTVVQNAYRLALDVEEVKEELQQVLGRRVVVVCEDLTDLPHEHLDMYAHLVDDKTVIVGDPRAALAAWDRMDANEAERVRLGTLGPANRDAQEAAIPAYKEVVRQLGSLGFRVARVPAVHARGGDVLLSWTNAVTEVRDGVAHAYVPAYDLQTLDRAAQAAWKEIGFQVHPIEAGLAVQEGGRPVSDERPSRASRPAGGSSRVPGREPAPMEQAHVPEGAETASARNPAGTKLARRQRSNVGGYTMSENVTSTGDLTAETVTCAICGESIPRNHSIVRADIGRICHFCLTDEQVDPDDDWDDDEDWDDEDWDDLD